MENTTPGKVGITEKQKAILNKFMLGSSCLDPLNEYINKVNIFKILKSSTHEIRHSNVLSWLLDANENHGLGDAFIKAFVREVLANSDKSYELTEWLYQDFYNAQVFTNWGVNKDDLLDILIVFDESKKIIAIENKVFSKENKHKKSGKSQTVSYHDVLDKKYPDYHKMLVFLTLDGEEPDDSAWDILTYHNIADILQQLMIAYTEKIHPKIKLIIDDYIDILEGEIMENNKLQELCTKIYKENRDALDLIYDNRIDETAAVADLLKVCLTELAAESNSNFVYHDDFDSGITYVRFATRFLNGKLGTSTEDNKCWNGSAKYQRHLYEFWVRELKNKDKNDLKLSLILTKKNLEAPQEKVLKAICDEFHSEKSGQYYVKPIKNRVILKDAVARVEAVARADDEPVNDLKNEIKEAIKKIVEDTEKRIQEAIEKAGN